MLSFYGHSYAIPLTDDMCLSPKGLFGVSDWPEKDFGIVGDFNFAKGHFLYEARGQYWLRSGNGDDFGTRQSFLFVPLLSDTLTLYIGGGFWFNSTQNNFVYPAEYPPDPDSLLDWFIELRPFVEVRAPLTFRSATITPVFRLQVSAYANFETYGATYKYVEPAVVFNYEFNPRWGLEVRARYWRGVGAGGADAGLSNAGFLEFGPNINW